MALSEVYVDPSIAADSGTGTLGDPYGDLEYAIEQTTFDTTNGTRINIKSGTAEVLAAGLNVALDDIVTTPAWVPTATAQLWIQGYTAVAGDGGIGVIDGNGSYGLDFFNATCDYVNLRDLHVKNSGAAALVYFRTHSSAIGCEFSGPCTNATAVNSGSGYHEFRDCYFHDMVPASQMLYAVNGTLIDSCYFDSNANTTYAVYCSTNSTARNCIVIVYGSRSGCLSANHGSFHNCSIYHATGDGTGSGVINGVSGYFMSVTNCLIEGFAGVGGKGIAGGAPALVDGCAFYNVTTEIDSVVLQIGDYYGDNETLTASPFNDAANGDFSPADVGNVIEGAVPQVIGGGLV